MTVKQLETKLAKERKLKITINKNQRDEAFNRGFNMFGKVKALCQDVDFSKKLFKLSIYDNNELAYEWNKGFQKANFS